jgi:hypothetical protein
VPEPSPTPRHRYRPRHGRPVPPDPHVHPSRGPAGAAAPPPRRRHRLAGGVAVLALSLSAAVAVGTANKPAQAEQVMTKTVVLGATADTYVSQSAPNKAYGSSTRLSATSKPGDSKTAYLRFAIPSALFGSVSKAVLVLTRDEHHFTGPVSLHTMANPSWNEATMTATSAPSYDATSVTVNNTSATVQTQFDVTAAARAYANPSFAITSSSTNDVARFRSREASVGDPQLILTVTVTVPTSQQTPPPSSSSSAPTSTPSPNPTPSTPSTPTTPSSTPTSSPTTPSPSSSSTTVPIGSFQRPNCAISAKLVPGCGLWWGVAPRCKTSISVTAGTAQLEADSVRPMDVVHQYHRNGGLFPNAAEKALALEPGRNRMLFLNWKPATDMTWRDVANGKADSRIDAEASYLRSSFNYPFFLTIWHEPENDVVESSGSGMTASDYSAMYHHVVARLRNDGATKFVSVMNYMGYVPWALKSWFGDLWPGDDVVDWVGIDPYASGDTSGYMSGDFNTLVNRTGAGFPGFYTWLTTRHASKPFMVAEWGVKEGVNNPDGKAKYYASVAANISKYPAIKAMVYFDEPASPAGEDAGDTEPSSSALSLAAWQKLGYDSRIVAPAFHYTSAGAVVEG